MDLLQLLKQFINSLNSKIIPNINTAIENIIFNEIEKKFENCIKIWKQNYSKINTNNTYNIRDIYDIKYFIMTEYNTVFNENQEIKYTKQFLELYENNKTKLENQIQNDINEIIKKRNNNIKNIITNEVINKYENINIFANEEIINNNLEKTQKDLVYKLLENNNY